MRRYRTVCAAILALSMVTLSVAHAAEGTCTVSTAQWKYFDYYGSRYYYVEASGTYTADMAISSVKISREVNGMTQELGVHPSPPFNAATKSGTWTITSSVYFLNPPQTMTVDAKTERNAQTLATGSKNLTFP